MYFLNKDFVFWCLIGGFASVILIIVMICWSFFWDKFCDISSSIQFYQFFGCRNLNKTQTAVIIGYEVVDGRCEPQLKALDVPAIIGNYLPAPGLVTSTAVVATVATTSAIIAKPLGDYLLKAVKPVVKKTVKKVKEKLGKKVPLESVLERRKYQRSLRK